MSLWRMLGFDPEREPAAGRGDAVRAIVDSLDRLDPERARHIAAFAYILGRVTRPHTRVVDEDVEPAKVGDSRRDGGLDLIEPGDIHLQREGAAAQRFDLSSQPLVGLDVTQAEHHVGPGVGKCERAAAPDALGGARDQSDLAGNLKLRVLVHAGVLLWAGVAS